MKKLLSVFLIIFSVFFLVACGEIEDNGGNGNDNGGNNNNTKEVVALTKEEINDIISEVDFDTVGRDVLSLETSIDIELALTAANHVLEEELDIAVKANGQFKVYADIEEFETSYIYINLEFGYELIGEEEDFLKLIGNLYDMYEEVDEEFINFDKIKKASFVGNIYIIAGVAYVNLEVKSGGTTITIEQYDDLFTEEEFNEAKESGDSEGFDMSLIDINLLPEELELKTYMVGDSYEFELWLTDNIEESLMENLDGLLEEMPIELEITHVGEIKNYISVKFSDVLENLTLVSQLDLGIELEMDDFELEVTAKTDVLFALDFSGSLPANLPTVEDLSDYVRGFDLDLLFE